MPALAPPAPLRIRGIALAIGITLSACFPNPTVVAADELLPAQRRSNYDELLALPLEQRIRSAPQDVLMLTWLGNLAVGEDVWPSPASHVHPLVPLIRNMIASLPAAVYELASRYLAGIFLVDHTFGSGRAEGLWDADDRLVAGYIVLNLSALSIPANTWASLHENSTFSSGGDTSIEVTLEPEASNDAESTLRFIFLHELGHVLGLSVGVHGHWKLPDFLGITRDSQFTRMSWQEDTAAGLFAPAKQTIPQLGMLQFYRFDDAPLPRKVAPQVYKRLMATNFASLYATLDPYEDFADAFALHVHTQLLGKPYQVTVREGEKVSVVYKSCLQTGGCPEKASYIQQILGIGR